jgi:hypothetical protein
MRTIRANEWKPATQAYLWVERGDGDLLPVTGIRSDWWIVTGYCSWCCTPGTILHVLDVNDDLATCARAMRLELAERRDRHARAW